MGVPKFFRYISERYPCLSELVKEYEIPEFDNLYLDMNGIIHMCSHPDDFDAHFRITEESIFKQIFHYIEVLFRMIKPHKLFFMAIDGVAPRAKMNQQRGRRFRSAKEAQKLEEKAKERGEILPEEARFDSNCITPGTEFMTKLQEQLKYFVSSKISTDKLWQGCNIILSGHETPGEGEHKIMDYIRYMRSQPGYDPHTRHCLYGLDADLIMLGLCSHEPNFSLLREEVRFGKKSTRKKTTIEEINFYLLHLSLMREYLELEFMPVKDKLPFKYDMECIIDDWVLMGFLVGNDFIPNLPNLHIANGALPTLYKAYMNVLPKLEGYINEGGTLNLQRFQKFMEELEQIDMENFSEHYADLKYFEGKTGRLPNENERTRYVPRKLEPWQDDSENRSVLKEIDDVAKDTVTKNSANGDAGIESTTKVSNKNVNSDLEALIRATNNMFLEPSEENLIDLSSENGEPDQEDVASEGSSSYDDLLDEEFKQHKKDYYMNKLDYSQVTPEVLKSQAEGYVRAIQWNLHYYYNGVCSWSWYYPHHYAPFISDIKNFLSIDLGFELGKPFKPFEQLLSVLPAASKGLLPKSYHQLMLSEDSIIKEYYPEDFKTDLNGKKQEWEAVVLIPFIDEKLLLEAMKPCNEELLPQEVSRNTHGPMLLYRYSTEDLGSYESPAYFPTIHHNFALCKLIHLQDITIPKNKLVKGAYPGIKMDVFYPGFPTLKHLKYTYSVKEAKVRVFDQPSRGESMILKIQDSETKPNLGTVAEELLGKTILVLWPHLVEAIVDSVSNSEFRYRKENIDSEFKIENQDNLRTWERSCKSVEEHYMDHLGIDVGSTDILVEVRLMIGRMYVFTSNGRLTLEKQWAKHSTNYPLQAIVKDVSVYEGKRKYYDSIEDLFKIGSKCFMLGHPHYGCLGHVVDSRDSLIKGRLRINIVHYDEPNFNEIWELEKSLKTFYYPLHVAAAKLGISRHVISRLTGTIFIVMGAQKTSLHGEELAKVNVGLNLKFNKRNEEIPGYSKKDRDWLYSQKAIDLVGEYISKFPKFFEYINTNTGNDVYQETDIFPEDSGSGASVKEIVQWIKQQPFYSVGRESCGTQCLEPDVVQELEKVIDDHLHTVNIKQVLMQVKPHLLYNPEMSTGCVLPDATASYRLYDRVVNIRESYTVPLGFTGTVIAIRRAQKPEDTMYDILFDRTFPGGLSLNCSSNRGYRMSCLSLINKSHGTRQMNFKTGKSEQVNYRPNTQQNPPMKNPQYYSGQHLQQQSAFARNCNAPRMSSQIYIPPHIYTPPNYAVPPIPYPSNYQPYVNPSPLPPSGPRLSTDFMPNFGVTHIKQSDTNLKNSKTFVQTNDKQKMEESENLKKLLGIDTGISAKTESKTTSVSNENNMMKISVQDIFAHASKASQNTSTSVQPLSYCLKLLSHCQTYGMGCPHYTYLKTSEGKFYSRLLLCGESYSGDLANSKEEASENVAKIILEKLEPQASSHMKVKVPVSFPAPPKQWCQLAAITPPKVKKDVSASTSVNVKSEVMGFISTKVNQRMVDIIPSNKMDAPLKIKPDVVNPSQIKQEVVEITSTVIKEEVVTPRIKQDVNKGSKFDKGFVPLQVVKQKMSKSSTSKENVSKNGETSKNKSVEKQDLNQANESENVTKGNDVGTKPKRQRKMRIAANLPGLKRQN